MQLGWHPCLTLDRPVLPRARVPSLVDDGRFRPLGRLKACRELRILVVHGQWNARVPIQAARRDVAMLRAGGLHVAFQAYPCAHRLTSPMLADVDI